MYTWPTVPVATLAVEWRQSGFYFALASISPDSGTPYQETVNERDITWIIQLNTNNIDGGVPLSAYYEYYLFRTKDGKYFPTPRPNEEDSRYKVVNKGATSQRVKVAEGKERSINHSISDTMEHEIEYYCLRLLAKVSGVSEPGSPWDTGYHYIYFYALLPPIYGYFILDYVPLGIVYCPPGQDMSASLKQGTEFALTQTLGYSRSVGEKSRDTAGVSVGIRGVFEIGTKSADETTSQAGSSTSSGIFLQNFRNTIITADNKTAIGRAYWGPLGDIFIIGRRAKYVGHFNAAADTFFWQFDSMEKILIAPVHRLLRPSQGDEIQSIPPEARRQLLELDPFIRKERLSDFIPDAAQPDLSIALSEAVDSTAIPSRNNRAELIGTWYPNAGTDLQYEIGDVIELKQGEGNQVSYSTGYEESFSGFSLAGLGFGIVEGGHGTFTQIGYQSSLETMNRSFRSAACHLVRNQNAADLRGIELYYDKIFGSLMFRLVSEGPLFISGLLVGVRGDFLDRIPIQLVLESFGDRATSRLSSDFEKPPKVFESTSTIDGRFEFRGLYPGHYRLKVGDKEVMIDGNLRADEKEKRIELTVTDVRRTLDLQKSPIWEIRRTLRLGPGSFNNLRGSIRDMVDKVDLIKVLGITEEQFEQLLKSVEIKFPRTSLHGLGEISLAQIESLRKLGVSSRQELWTEVKEKGRLDDVAREAQISPKLISKWLNEVDSKRPSKGGQPAELAKPRRSGIFKLHGGISEGTIDAMAITHLLKSGKQKFR